MRRPNLLTPAGRYVLTRLTRGWVLVRDERGFVMTERAWVERVYPLTALRLVDAGHIVRGACPGTYRITDVGRVALEEEQGP